MDDTLRVIEFGRCRVERRSEGPPTKMGDVAGLARTWILTVVILTLQFDWRKAAQI